MTSWLEPQGYTIFCDDVRQEVNGKTSLIGVYGADMLINVPFPVTLAHLALVVNIILDPRDPRREDIELRVSLPNDPEDVPLIKMTIPISSIYESRLNEDVPDEDVRLRFGVNLVIAPITLTQPGTIKVRAILGETVIKLGSLIVRGKPAQTDEKRS